MGLGNADLPILHRQLGELRLAVGQFAGSRAPVDEAAGVAGIVENEQDLAVIGHRPPHLAMHSVGPGGQRHGVLAEPFQSLHRGPRTAERSEHEGDCLHDRAVGVEHDLVAVVVGQAEGKAHLEFAAPRLAALTAEQARADALHLVFRERALEPQEKPVVAVVGIVEAVFVEDQRVAEGGDLEEPLPVRCVAAQPRHLEAEDDAHLADGEAVHEVAEAVAVAAVFAGCALVVINGADALMGPAQRDCALAQPVLTACALGVVDDLLLRRLADVQAGLSPAVMFGDLEGSREVRHDSLPRHGIHAREGRGAWRRPRA